MTLPTLDQIIAHYRLQPLPIEGGHYRETWVSEDVIPTSALSDRFHNRDESKPFGTCIHYLLTDHPDSFSALHKLPTDEVWHFYMGESVELLQLYPDGRHAVIRLGHDLLNGEIVQFAVPRGVWMGARLVPGRAQAESFPSRYALMGMTMSPGYTQSDYVHGDRAALLAQYPAAADWINALTR